jgi:Pectate lyase superfamily protein
MTVNTTANTVSYSPVASTGPFAITFPYLDPTYLTVTLNGVVLVNGVGYNISAGAVVTTAPATGTLIITRDTPALQPTSFGGGTFDPSVLETALDRQTMVTQDGGASLPIASALVLGGVKVGSGLAVAGDGTLSAAAVSSTWLNIKSDGSVKGDGSTDDSAAIQTIVNANPGKTIFFPAATYVLNTKITVPANTSIMGDGMSSTIFKVPSTAASAFYFGSGYGSPSTHNYISRCGFNTKTNASPTAGRMIESNLTELWVSDIYIARGWDGLYINGTHVATRLRLSACRNADIHVTGTTLCNISEFIITGYDDYAAVPGIINVGHGILLDGTVGGGVWQDIKLSKGDILFGDAGIKIIGLDFNTADAPSFIKIDQVLCDTVGSNPLWIDWANGVTVTNSWFTNGTSHGIYTDHVHDFRLIGCDVYANTGYGLLFGANSSSVRVMSSNFSHNSTAGIRASAAASDFVIQGNRVGPAQAYGAGWSGKSQAAGIIVDAAASDRYVIADNLVSGNTGAGVTDGGTGVNKRVANNY